MSNHDRLFVGRTTRAIIAGESRTHLQFFNFLINFFKGDILLVEIHILNHASPQYNDFHPFILSSNYVYNPSNMLSLSQTETSNKLVLRVFSLLPNPRPPKKNGFSNSLHTSILSQTLHPLTLTSWSHQNPHHLCPNPHGSPTFSPTTRTCTLPRQPHRVTHPPLRRPHP